MDFLMRVLEASELKLLKSIFSLKEVELLPVLYKFLNNKYNKVSATEDFIIAEGDIPIALVAHLDTVFPTPPKDFYYDRVKNVMWSPQGLGADDRAGVFAIVKILMTTNLRPHIIFTTQEECGGIGASALSELPCPFKDLRYIIELDRRGTNDCVFYNCYNEDFIKYIESFGFFESFGTFSDISFLCPDWKIAGVNLSIGYENEHSYTEHLYINGMFKTIQKVKNMLEEENIPKFEYIEDTSFYCGECNARLSENEMIKVKGLTGFSKYYCIDCISKKHVDWCHNCHEAFEIDPKAKSSFLCKDCLGG